MKIHKLKGYIQNMYLVEYPHGLLLLDSGTRADVPMVLEFIKNQLQRSTSDLKLVIATHAHPDHSGGANEFKKLGIAIAGPEKLNQWYNGLSGITAYWLDILLTYLVRRRTHKDHLYKNVLFPRKVKFNHHLAEGHSLPAFDEWTVLECPGHTASDISLYHSQTQTAYIADNLIAHRSGIIPPYPIHFPDLYKNSLQRYIDLNITSFLLAHYGSHNLTHSDLKLALQKAPHSAKNHRNSILRILKRMVKKKSTTYP